MGRSSVKNRFCEKDAGDFMLSFIHELLRRTETQEIAFCSGGRNREILLSLKSEDRFNIHHFVDERSAAFFALGRIKRDGKPAAVITTSGTAVGELMPAL